MKSRNLLESFNHAIMGIAKAVKSERNLKIHILVGTAVLFFSYYFNLSKMEIVILILTIGSVIAAEMMNTALEYALDAVIKEYNPLVKAAKDIAAGAVFVTAFIAMAVGYFIFWDKLKDESVKIFNKLLYTNPYLIFFVLCSVCAVTLLLKLMSGKGTPLKGGFPSGHSALAFSIATIIAYVVGDTFGIVLSYLLALLVAQSRVDSNVHSILEVVLGGILGILMTILLLNVFAF